MNGRLSRRAGTRMVGTGPLMALAVALPLLLSACSDRMGHGFDWKRMRQQNRYDPYSANPMFVDGSAMRTPPAGTISREAMLVGAPPPTTNLVRGESRFHIYCAVCHGERADGVSIVASNMDAPRPPSLIAPPARDLPPQQIFDVITSGLGRMPSFASQLSAEDRWQVIAYLATLQQRAQAGVEP